MNLMQHEFHDLRYMYAYVSTEDRHKSVRRPRHKTGRREACRQRAGRRCIQKAGIARRQATGRQIKDR